ncbi:MAG: chemotaxis protein CheD [Fimbriimonadaceae bacterium]
MTESVSSGAFLKQPSPVAPALREQQALDLMIGLAEIQVVSGLAKFTFAGLGSCVGVCVLDPEANVAGAVHIMLPKSLSGTASDMLGKFADTGIEELVRLMLAAGADVSRMQVAYAGGANVGDIGGRTSACDLGSRNLETITHVLADLRLPVKATDAGGTTGRTLRMSSQTGDVLVRTIRMGEAKLCSLRS